MSSFAFMSQLFQTIGTNLSSLAKALIIVQTMFNNIVPGMIRDYVIKVFSFVFEKASPSKLTLVVDQRIGYDKNHVYEAAEAYLRTIINPAVDRLKVMKTQSQKKFTVSIEKGEKIVDTYEGMKITWKYVFSEGHKKQSRTNDDDDKYYFEIVFEKKFKEKVLGSYLPYVMNQFDQIKKEEKVVRIYTRGRVGFRDMYDENSRGRIKLN